jgi:hypothetical protein
VSLFSDRRFQIGRERSYYNYSGSAQSLPRDSRSKYITLNL